MAEYVHIEVGWGGVGRGGAERGGVGWGFASCECGLWPTSYGVWDAPQFIPCSFLRRLLWEDTLGRGGGHLCTDYLAVLSVCQ